MLRVVGSTFFRETRKEFHLVPNLNLKMPKKDNNAKGKVTNKKQETSIIEKSAVYCGSNNEIIIKIHAKPGAKESGITDVGEDSVGIQISAPPVDGAANKELIRYLGEVLNLRKSDLSLEKGSRSKDKTVIISSSSVTVNDVLTKLKVASKQ
ncbi:UPF0235 protein C15orf40 homolog [Trichonephila clavata]|uniref:UPF0235 protein C15orf40 homolog n=1 Tax=Trichonephila clavata TaxID=2740835 RepID=A0A8X6KDF5_TRICU|nr:UPF0235 protein C15orf40 homolog [Trichonephila clavata]